MVGPACPVGKIRTREVRAKGGDAGVGHLSEIADEGQRLPAPGMSVEAKAVVIRAEGRDAGDRVAVVHSDGQVAALDPHREVRIGAEGLEHPVQGVGFVGHRDAARARLHIAMGFARGQGRRPPSLQRIAGEGPRKGWARSRFHAAMNARTAVHRSSIEWKLASRKHWRWRMLKNSSTWLTQEACLGV